MSNVDATRLGAVQALTLSPSQVIAGMTYPTIAGARVYDSRIDLIANAQSPEDLEAALASLENQPLLVVFTEEHSVHPYGADAGTKYPSREEVVVLVVEALIGAKGIVEVGLLPDGITPITVGTLEAPVTDGSNEFILGRLVAQVRRALDPKNRDPAGAAFRFVAMEYREFHSTPQRAADRAFRLASRTLKFHLKIKADVWPVMPATGFPEPLASVLSMLPPDHYIQATATQLAKTPCGDPMLPIPGNLAAIVTYGNVDNGLPTATDYDIAASLNGPSPTLDLTPASPAPASP